MSKTIGYARASNTQSIERQVHILKEAGATDIYTDNSMLDPHRSNRAKALDALGEGDTLLVCDLDRLVRRPRDLEEVLERSERGNFDIRSLQQGISLRSPEGHLHAHISIAMATKEDHAVRTRQGIAHAKARRAAADAQA